MTSHLLACLIDQNNHPTTQGVHLLIPMCCGLHSDKVVGALLGTCYYCSQIRVIRTNDKVEVTFV